MDSVTAAFLAGLKTSAGFFWDSLFGLIFGFLISAVVQVAATPRQMERWLGPNLRGIGSGALFGVIASACSYGAAAAARGFYQRGADARSVFAFLISSTNMNVAIVILFWTLLGWKFAFAEFFGGALIIVVVTAGLSLWFSGGRLAALQAEHEAEEEAARCHLHDHHKSADDGERASLASRETWAAIWQTMLADVAMLRWELLVGYLIAGFAAALVPPQWLSSVLNSVRAVPGIGYLLLLFVGLLLAVITFVCSMGNVPIARFLAQAGIPLGANTTFIYGDLLVPPMVAIYRKSFPRQIVVAFVVLFTLGALLAGAIMDLVIGHGFGGFSMGSMAQSDRFTLYSNIAAIAATLALWVAAQRRGGPSSVSDESAR
ncbi:MAG: permease [Candidatus Eremiobacteraeota bacterium]|nr:permease [Candidatus Eremiobacteraeota bacterium]